MTVWVAAASTLAVAFTPLAGGFFWLQLRVSNVTLGFEVPLLAAMRARGFVSLFLGATPRLGTRRALPGLARLRYAHSTAIPQSYPASIGSGRGILKCKALIVL